MLMVKTGIRSTYLLSVLSDLGDLAWPRYLYPSFTNCEYFPVFTTCPGRTTQTSHISQLSLITFSSRKTRKKILLKLDLGRRCLQYELLFLRVMLVNVLRKTCNY